MTLPSLPSQGDTSWYDWAEGIHDTLAVAAPSVSQGGRTQRLIGDTDVFARTGGTGNAAQIVRTDRARQLLIIANTAANTLNVAEGSLDSDTAPGSGYTAVAAGSEYVTASQAPIYAYFSTTDGYVRVYAEIGA